MDVTDAKAEVSAAVDRLAAVLVEASRQIHANPELGFEEHFAHDLLTGLLEAEGLSPDRGAFGLPTAFSARAGSTGPVVAVLCEYDALPGLGHACGHNIIAAAGLGAGLAAATVAEACGGQVVILGTPAEEGGGGKVKMADRGAFDGVTAAMMVHPAGADLDAMQAIAVQQIWVEYHGRAAHAAAFPHRGRNALDAAVLGYQNVAALRQHIRPDERLHGIFTAAGEQANIVPRFASARWYVRAANVRRLEPLKERVFACLQAGADAAGCEMTYDWKEPVYADLIPNPTLVGLYGRNLATTGRVLHDHRQTPGVVGSTDMGNVSHLVPSIHPMIQVGPPNVPIHSPEFAEYTCSDAGDRAVLDGARAMAMTVVDIWLDDAARRGMVEEFDRSTSPSAEADGST